MTSLILMNAAMKIARFNDGGLHYNLVADEIYGRRYRMTNLFDESFLRYIVAGLVVFEMERMIGINKYDFKSSGFGFRLTDKLQKIKESLEPLLKLDLAHIDFQEHWTGITKAYESLSASGAGALHENQKKHFHVGATKILHFLNPDLFIIIDSNAARAYRMAWKVPFRNTTQPGYSASRYLTCMKYAQADILNYGLERFKALEPGTPLTRIYDKLTFVTA